MSEPIQKKMSLALRIHCQGEMKTEGRWKTAPSVLATELTQRSGRSPALPYPLHKWTDSIMFL